MSQTKAQLLAPIGIITGPGLDVTTASGTTFQLGSTGIITAVSANFSGNVTVGGTLTYEDVTNIDSVGLITARSGIDVTAGGIDITAGGIDVAGGGANIAGVVTASTGINAASNLILNTGGSERLRIASAGQIGIAGTNYGTDGQILTSQGNAAAPTWSSMPAGGNTVDLVADGAIAAGKACIIKTDGKTAQIKETLGPVNPPVAEGDATNSSVNGSVSAVYHTGLDKYVIIGKSGDAYWQTAENNGSNTSISFSSQYLLLGYSLVACMACYNEYYERVIFVWWNGQFNAATSLMVATHGPNLNSAADFNAGNSYQIGNRARPISAIYYAPVNICCFMVNDYDSDLGILYMLDVTTSTTVADNLVNKKATITLDPSATIQFGGLATDGTVIVVAYKKDAGAGVYYKIITGTNATTYTVTAEAQWLESSITVEQMDITYDANAGKYVMVFKNSANNYLSAVVGTLSGTGSSATISWGTSVQMNTDPLTAGVSCKYDPSRKETLVIRDVNQTGYASYISISGTTPTWGTAVILDGSFFPITNKGDHYGIVRNPDSKQMMTYWTTAASNGGSASRYELVTGASITTNLSNDKRNFIGFAEDAIGDGATGTIKLRGNVIGNQSGLTIGDMYEVQGAGTLNAAWQSNSVGLKAIAADKGIICENTGI